MFLSILAAVWISGGTASPEAAAPILSRAFVFDKVPAEATLELAVDGWCEVEVNGRRVSEDVLSPVTCQPDKRISSLTFDVRPFVKTGTNVVSVLLGNGWKNAFTIDTWGFHCAPWVGAPRCCGELVADGAKVLGTDGSWQAEDSPIVFNALRNGEWYDARREGTPANVRPAKVEKYAPGGIVSSEDATPCRAGETLVPVKTLRTPEGDAVYDFGANIAGWCEIDVVGKAGAKVTIDYDESLTPSNTPLGHVASLLGYRGAKDSRPAQHDEYTLAGRANGESWHPRFTYHGFRYARVKSFGEVALKAIRARFVHSAFPCAGKLETSDKVFAALQDATLRSYRSNFVGIPTDCPHREKNGWTGDAQLACETGLWNFDSKAGYVHFLRMILDSQLPNGAVSCIAPCCPEFGHGWGSGPAWDAVLFVLPRQIYRFDGDDGPVREAYDAMKRYVDFIMTKVESDGLVEYGLGDWCCCWRIVKDTPTRLTDSAYVYHFNRELADWARHFGEAEVAKACDLRADAIRDAFNRAYWKGDGLYCEGQWPAQAAPLYFKGLCVAGEDKNVAKRLVESVRAAKHHAHFGILGAKWVPRVLADYGYADDAWRLFVQPETPGWAYWLKFGDGTLRENWDSSASHNHIMFGDLSAWAYEYAGGIVPLEPGFKKVALRPRFLEGVERFAASHRTPQGEIKVEWHRENGKPVFTYSVPKGIEIVGLY